MNKLAFVVESVTPETLLKELSSYDPPPQEKWYWRNDFDPTYGARELRRAAQKGWIELETNDDPNLWRFRLTPLGRLLSEQSNET